MFPIVGLTNLQWKFCCRTRSVVITAESAVSIRAGNGKDYPEARRANPGDAFDWVATTENGWHALKLVNYVGWIDGKYCRIE